MKKLGDVAQQFSSKVDFNTLQEQLNYYYIRKDADRIKDDFKEWIQERSIYHAVDIDSHYENLITMHDPQEKDDDGALIMTDYGKGKFIYTGISFFRQLPAGVSGAYRFFVNLISSNPKY